MKRTEISIYGKKYKVNSDYENKYIDKLTFYVNGKLKELKMKNPRLEFQDACALGLLHVADDLLREKEKYVNLTDSYKDMVPSAKLDDLNKEKVKLEKEIQKQKNEISELKKINLDLKKLIENKDNELITARTKLEDSYKKVQELLDKIEDK